MATEPANQVQGKGLLEKLSDRLAKLAGEDASIGILKEEIEGYQALLREYNELLDQQSAGGFNHAIVIAVGKEQMKLYRDQRYGDFKLDSSVTISKASPFNLPSYPDGVGKIIEFDPVGKKGWALVDFGGGRQHAMRYGHPDVDKGLSDLVLLAERLTKDTERPVITVSMNGQICECLNLFNIKCQEGDTVLVHPHTNYVIAITNSVPKGLVSTIDEVVDAGILVTIEGRKRLVGHPRKSESWKPEKGDRVLVDDGLSVILSHLPRPQSIAIASDIEPVDWDDVIGLTDAKKELMRVLNELAHQDLFNAYDADPAKGILLFGPPGNGKTHIGKAIATRIQKLLGSDGDMVRGFMYIKATEILDMYVGEAPRKIRDIFAKAEEYFRRTKQKAIIFIDEVESVLQKRGQSHDSGSSDSITNAFLTELDGIQRNYAFVIGATNRIDLIDQAAMRAGRFDRKIYVGRPEEEYVPKFFELQLRKVRLAKDVTTQQAVEFASAQYLSTDYTLYNLYYEKKGVDPSDDKIPLGERLRHERFKLSHLGSGAMIKTIINNAKAKAIERDIEAKVTGDAVSGLTLEDIRLATKEIFEENKRLKNQEDINEFLAKEDASPYEVKEAA